MSYGRPRVSIMAIWLMLEPVIATEAWKCLDKKPHAVTFSNGDRVVFSTIKTTSYPTIQSPAIINSSKILFLHLITYRQNIGKNTFIGKQKYSVFDIHNVIVSECIRAVAPGPNNGPTQYGEVNWITLFKNTINHFLPERFWIVYRRGSDRWRKKYLILFLL